MDDICSRLRSARGTRQQKDIAEAAGLADGRTLWRFENGRKAPTIAQAQALAEALGVDPAWLLTAPTRIRQKARAGARTTVRGRPKKAKAA